MDRHPAARSCSCTVRGDTSCCTGVSSCGPSMHVCINSTTGTRFELSLPCDETVDGLKRRLAQRLGVSKERLSLLHKETTLSTGQLRDLGVASGSKLTLVPSVESGLMSQTSRHDHSITQALESLTEAQVSDFLGGRSPLTLALRVGEHMMFVQLQLAEQPLVSSRGPSALQGISSNTRSPPGPLRSPSSTGGSSTMQGKGMPGLGDRGPSGIRGTPILTESSSAGSCGHVRPEMGTSTPSSSPKLPSTSTPSNSTSTPTPQTTAGPQTAGRRKSGAVIQSFVNHAPGVFSGTFSGTLHPSCQDNSGRPRRDITTILQILNDLLSATRHYQGSPPTPSPGTTTTPPSSSPPPSPTLSPPLSPAINTYTPLQQQQHHTRTLGPERERLYENKATRSKVEHLQRLLQQRRLRRKARRGTRHAPYAWSSGSRRLARSHSNSSASSSSSPTSATGSPGGDGSSLEMDYEDAVWKAEVPSTDLSNEFIMA